MTKSDLMLRMALLADQEMTDDTREMLNILYNKLNKMYQIIYKLKNNQQFKSLAEIIQKELDNAV